jgi:Flp pilus assembly protein protease CpaA
MDQAMSWFDLLASVFLPVCIAGGLFALGLFAVRRWNRRKEYGAPIDQREAAPDLLPTVGALLKGTFLHPLSRTVIVPNAEHGRVPGFADGRN